jgi:uncharacterized integral membrane protein
MHRKLLLILLFIVVLVFVVFLGLNWETRFYLKLGFGSKDMSVSVIAWTLGAFVAGALCTFIIFATNLVKKERRESRKARVEKEGQ